MSRERDRQDDRSNHRQGRGSRGSWYQREDNHRHLQQHQPRQPQYPHRRQYRRYEEETPSHPGGINRQRQEYVRQHKHHQPYHKRPNKRSYNDDVSIVTQTTASMTPASSSNFRQSENPTPLLHPNNHHNRIRQRNHYNYDKNDKNDKNDTTSNTKKTSEEEWLEDCDFYLRDDESGMIAGTNVESTSSTAPKGVGIRGLKQQEYGKDQDAWEELRLKSSGVISNTSEHNNDDTKNDTVVQLWVHATTPPFLKELNFQQKATAQAATIVDNSCDFAKCAREGSAILKYNKQTQSKKSTTAYWDLSKSTNSRISQAILQSDKKISNDDDDNNSSTTSHKNISTYQTNNNKKSSSNDKATSREEMWKGRRDLPVATVRDDLMQVIRENSVVIVVGETGSGKTTQLTQYLLEDSYPNMIGCTQPRRVAAMSVAQRVHNEYTTCHSKEEKLGQTVGYTIRFEDVTSEKTRIKYMTDGVLLRESLKDESLSQYSVIIMDEAHERSLNTDVLFGILKRTLRKRFDVKVLVTSATLSADKFSNYFGQAPIFRIPGRTYPVQTLFSQSVQTDYVLSAVKQALQIHFNNDEGGDILIFMSGQEDIEGTCMILQEKLDALNEDHEDPKPMWILPMYSQLPAELQSKIFAPTNKDIRKCIVSTNVAETSLTVHGIKYVIDAGFCKLKVYNPKIGMDALHMTPISRANANQRSGRAGRTGPGICYRLYTEHQYFNEMLEMTTPEIQRTNLSNVVLLLKSCGIQNVLTDFEFMDPPSTDTIASSLYQLWALGALNHTGQLTTLGKQMSDFPLDPSLSKMVLYSPHVVQDVLIVVSMLSVPPVWIRTSSATTDKEKQEALDKAKEKFSVPESDHLTLLNIYLRAQQHKFSNSWCTSHYLQSKNLHRAQEVCLQLQDIYKLNNGDSSNSPNNSRTDWDGVRRAVCSAYFTNGCKMKGIGTYTNLLTGVSSHIHPSSALFGLGYTPDYVVYHELISTTREYMSIVTAVHGEWLAESGPMFFSIKNKKKTQQQPTDSNQTAKTQNDDSLQQSNKNSNQQRPSSQKNSKSRVATPGRYTHSSTPKFMPKKRGRLGF